MRVRSGCVARETRGPTHDGIARVVQVEIGILNLAGRILGEDGVLEAGFLEHVLPVLYPLAHVPLPPGGRRGIQIVHDRFHRLHQLTACVCCRIFWLQPPPRDKLLTLGFLYIETVVHTVDREVAHPRVGVSRTHRRFWQQHERLARFHRDRRAIGIRGGRGGIKRLHLPHFDVDGESAHAADVTAGGIIAAHAVRATLIGIKSACRGVVVREEVGYVDHVRCAVAAERGNRKRADDRRIVILRHAARDRQRVVGHGRRAYALQQHAVVHALPPDKPFIQ